MNATDIAAALARRAEQVCRRYLPHGRKQGRYWTAGDARGTKGRSLFVRLAPPGAPGKWTDAATGEHGDLLDLIRLGIGTASLKPTLDEARAFLAMPAAPAGGEAAAYDRIEAARRLWRACRAIDGTHAEDYLQARAIHRCRFPSLRFHPALNYRDRRGFRRLPALVAGDDGAIDGIHRTWLDPAAPAKADVAHPRKALGHVHGRAVDRLAPEMRELGRAQDGTEVKSWELERITERAHNLGDRRDAFEKLRDFAADAYHAETGEQWRPRHGSHASLTGKLTSAAIDARDFIRARKDRETRAHLPDGTLVAVAGGKEAEDVRAIWSTLDRVKTRHADVILVHGGSPGAEKIAASWAERNDVHQIVCKPDWDRHGRAAPFRRNDDLLNLLPKGVVAFPGSGITENLVDKARRLGIPVHRVAA